MSRVRNRRAARCNGQGRRRIPSRAKRVRHAGRVRREDKRERRKRTRKRAIRRFNEMWPGVEESVVDSILQAYAVFDADFISDLVFDELKPYYYHLLGQVRRAPSRPVHPAAIQIQHYTGNILAMIATGTLPPGPIPT